MPREVVLYNPEHNLIPRMRSGYTYKLMHEARSRVDGTFKHEIHQFKSGEELERQLQGVFVSHQTNPIDKLVIDVHGGLWGGGDSPAEISIKKYAGDLIGQIRNRDDTLETVSAFYLSSFFKTIQSPTKIPELRLISCNSGVLSVQNNLARTFLRSNLFNYVVAEDMVVTTRLNVNIFRTSLSLKVIDEKYQPRVRHTPNPNVPTRTTKTFLAYCAPGNDYRPSEKTVVFYHMTNPDPALNVPIERWDNYRKDLPFADLSNHPGKDFPASVTTPKRINVRRFPCIPW